MVRNLRLNGLIIGKIPYVGELDGSEFLTRVIDSTRPTCPTRDPSKTLTAAQLSSVTFNLGAAGSERVGEQKGKVENWHGWRPTEAESLNPGNLFNFMYGTQLA